MTHRVLVSTVDNDWWWLVNCVRHCLIWTFLIHSANYSSDIPPLPYMGIWQAAVWACCIVFETGLMLSEAGELCWCVVADPRLDASGWRDEMRCRRQLLIEIMKQRAVLALSVCRSLGWLSLSRSYSAVTGTLCIIVAVAHAET